MPPRPIGSGSLSFGLVSIPVKLYSCLEDDEVLDREVKERPRDAIDILELVPGETISPLFYERAYYLAPDRGGAKAYALFARALEKSERVAIARHAARGNEHVVVIRQEDGVLVLQQLRFADEKLVDETAAEDCDTRAQVVDLMAAPRASLAAGQRVKRSARRSERRSARRAS
jgi:non-homologous end joining protein Ku